MSSTESKLKNYDSCRTPKSQLCLVRRCGDMEIYVTQLTTILLILNSYMLIFNSFIPSYRIVIICSWGIIKPRIGIGGFLNYSMKCSPLVYKTLNVHKYKHMAYPPTYWSYFITHLNIYWFKNR